MKKHQKPGKINYSKKDVAIVVPVHKNSFSLDEERSLNQLNLLKGYSFFLVIPERLKNAEFSKLSNFKKVIVKSTLDSYSKYNQLLKTKEFYKNFEKFKFILIYQTDCLIFKDNLLEFCNLDYDYIGAPIFYNPHNGNVKGYFIGNGGFSLRKVSSAIKVLERRKNILRRLIWATPYLFKFPKKIFNRLILKSDHPIASLVSRNEDVFWSCEAKKFYPSFKIAPLDVACKFSIENGREKCKKMNKGILPFGCHAYQLHKNFWEKWSGIKMFLF